jgi:hypothetical protein
VESLFTATKAATLLIFHRRRRHALLYGALSRSK